MKRLHAYYDQLVERPYFKKLPVNVAVGNIFVAGILCCLSAFLWGQYSRDHEGFILFLAPVITLSGLACAFQSWQILLAMLRSRQSS